MPKSSKIHRLSIFEVFLLFYCYYTALNIVFAVTHRFLYVIFSLSFFCRDYFHLSCQFFSLFIAQLGSQDQIVQFLCFTMLSILLFEWQLYSSVIWEDIAYGLTFLNLLRGVLFPKIWSILENVSLAFEYIVHSIDVEENFLCLLDPFAF